jgi:hypothetical protein
MSVLYLGISDTPAWVVSKANQYARDHGLAPFVGGTTGSASFFAKVLGHLPRQMVCCRKGHGA